MGAPRPAVSRLRTDSLLDLLINSVTDCAMFVLNLDGIVASWNPGAERIKGYAAVDIIGRHFSVFYRTQDKADGRCERLLRAAREHGRVEDEGWRVRKDGSLFWANVVITALKDGRGRLVGYAKVTRDLSERKTREQALARANTEVEDTAEFLAHDVNELLTRVSTFGALLEAKPLDEDERNLLTYMVDNVARVRALIAGTLECRKAASERAAFTQTSLSVVVGEAARQLTKELRVTGVEVSYGQLPVVHGDAALLGRMFRHLLLTIAMVGRAGASTTILVDAIQRENDWVIRLRAAGPPPKADFETCDAVASSTDLAVVMKIASMHGGAVWARSSPVPGGQFFVSLPVVEPADSPS